MSKRKPVAKTSQSKNAATAPPPDAADIVTLNEQEVSYRIVLPNRETDYIQKGIVESQHPYELEMLEDMASRLQPGDRVLDVGANIGNHTMYLAAVAGAQVTAFEPNAPLATAIRQSAARLRPVPPPPESRGAFGMALPSLVASCPTPLPSTTSSARSTAISACESSVGSECSSGLIEAKS